jgi:CubicO group peptidase (beta-lactamase class C family)
MDSDFQPLHDRIVEAMERLHVPGVAVGIIHDGKEQVAGFGVTNVDHPAPVGGDTLFQIGSTTKTVTATAVMRLVERGQIDLYAPIRSYLPELRLSDEAAAAGVTMHHLLTHTGGWIGDFFQDTGRGEDALEKIVAKLAEVPQLTSLGEIWSYNNAGFYLAGRVIEVLTDRPYELAAKELVLEPLEMNRSFFFPEEVMVHSFAVGHNVIDGTPTVTTPWPVPRSANPVGGITSSAPDQLRYARFHMGDGKTSSGVRILSPESMKRMQTPTMRADEGREMGLSWFLRDVDGVHIVQHGGGTNGQLSAFMFAPKREFALTILTNADRGSELNLEVTRWALHRYLGVMEPEPVHLEQTAEELAAYAGRYVAPLSDLDLVVRDSVLMLEMTFTDAGLGDKPRPSPPPSRVAFYEADKFVALEGPMKDTKGEFLRRPDGDIAWLRLGGRIRKREM